MKYEGKIDLDTAKNLIEKAIADKGEDYVYPRAVLAAEGMKACEYFEPDETTGAVVPSCIVGYALAYIGVEAEDLGNENGGTVWDMVTEADLAIDIDAANFWMNVQQLQDRGVPWGQAYAQALSEIGEV
jgi:hypothetical protein